MREQVTAITILVAVVFYGVSLVIHNGQEDSAFSAPQQQVAAIWQTNRLLTALGILLIGILISLAIKEGD